MATLKSVIALVDELHPNQYSPEMKTVWVNAVEGRVQLNILLKDSAEVLVYNWKSDQDTELLVKPPHDDLYVLWLRAQIHAATGEWDEYANALQMYNAAYGDFLRWFAGRYRPANGYAAVGGGSDNPPYYLTAYGLAVKRGFQGTEEEWLASLKGADGATGPAGAGVSCTVLYENVAGHSSTGSVIEGLAADPSEYDYFEVTAGKSGFTFIAYPTASGSGTEIRGGANTTSGGGEVEMIAIALTVSDDKAWEMVACYGVYYLPGGEPEFSKSNRNLYKIVGVKHT